SLDLYLFDFISSSVILSRHNRLYLAHYSLFGFTTNTNSDAIQYIAPTPFANSERLEHVYIKPNQDPQYCFS
ncbi:hypothetical protein, partial [Oleiphilus sp. HI0123]|uniref:hypothetical protein n=1 Tax=Oleiphilus sp. HI0123 TaxID=1822265 RepID=UPI001E3D57C7